MVSVTMVFFIAHGVHNITINGLFLAEHIYLNCVCPAETIDASALSKPIMFTRAKINNPKE